eukprot:scaffold6216_cov124-Skeletonema_marinoi.AAC.2
MSSSPTGLKNDEEAGGGEIGNMFPMEEIAEDDDYDDCWPLNLPDNNDGHNNNEHQRPSTSESCTRGDHKRTRTRTSAGVEQSGEGGDDGNADDISTSSSSNDDDNLRQQDEDLFASLIVTISSSGVATIVETLLKRNSRACLRVMNDDITYRYATKLRKDASIICDVNHIDNSLLQELVKSCQGGETHCAQDKPVICCINHDSKLLIYRCEDGTPATKQLCPYRGCIKLKVVKRYGCNQHMTNRNGHTSDTRDQMDNTDSNESNLFDDVSLHAADKPLLEQLGNKILRLAPPQQKIVADLLRQDCREAVGETNKFHNVLLKLDEIPSYVLDFLCLKMNEFEVDSEKYHVRKLLGIQQQSLEDEDIYINMIVRCISLRNEWRLDSDRIHTHFLDEDGRRKSNSKSSKKSDRKGDEDGRRKSNSKSSKKSDRKGVQTNHLPWDPRICSMEARIEYTNPPSLRDYQRRMTGDRAFRRSAEDALKCINEIQDSALRKSTLDAYRKKAGLGENDPVTVDDIEKILHANVMRHTMIGGVECPALDLLHHALNQDEYKDLLDIVPTNELPPPVKRKYANDPAVLGDFAVMIRDPKRFIENCMAQLWGHMNMKYFRSSFDYRDFKVIFKLKNTNSPYICIISNTITSDQDSLLGSSSMEQLNVELKAMKAKEKLHLEMEKQMVDENLRLKARITELEGGLGDTGTTVDVMVDMPNENEQEAAEESYAAILTKSIPRKSNAREQAAEAAAAAAVSPPVQLLTTPGPHTSTVVEPAGTSLHSGGDGANAEIAGSEYQNWSLVPPPNMSGGNNSLRNSSRGEGGQGTVPGRVDYRPINLAPSHGGGRGRGRGGGGGGGGGRGISLRSGGGRGGQGYVPGGRRGRGPAPDRVENRPPNLAPSHGAGGGGVRRFGDLGREDCRPHNSAPSHGGGGVFHSVGHTRTIGYGSSNNNSSLHHEQAHGTSYGGGERRLVGKIKAVLGNIGKQYGFINSEEFRRLDGSKNDVFVYLGANIFEHIRDKKKLCGSSITFELTYEGNGKAKAIWPKLIEEQN